MLEPESIPGLLEVVREQRVGSLSWHVGDLKAARKFARTNLAAFSDLELDAVVTTAAGCGSGMQEYGLILEGSGLETEARDLAGKVIDVSAFLMQIGLDPPPPAFPEPVTVAYHDACLVQLRHHLGEQGEDKGPFVRHTVEIVAEAYRNQS